MSKYEGKLTAINFTIHKIDNEERYSVSLHLILPNSRTFGVALFCDTPEEVISTYKGIFSVFGCNNTEFITDGTEDVLFELEDKAFIFTSLRTGRNYVLSKKR